MADGQVDVSRLERKIDSLSAQTQQVCGQVTAIGNQMTEVKGQVNSISRELTELRKQFEEEMRQQRKVAAMHKAATELVRIRQELDQEFGHYRVVRETMLGVLQATDLALVKETTISRVSEELMLATPDYWLAPCLVAVSAWISNNRDLAERAIAEAMRRDEEKTALAMALICRRNGRVSTCYEWLGIYFEKQDASKISESGYTCIDAYINGVFGPDEKHICDDYVAKWLEELNEADSELESHQQEEWRAHFSTFHKESEYPVMKESVTEFNRIDAYVGRILSVDTIRSNFKRISEGEINDRELKEKVDELLIKLVRQHTDKEQVLRDEEALQMMIKVNGDERSAHEKIKEQQQKRKDEAVNLIKKMSQALRGEGETSISKKKTAISFLGGYINKGYGSYITEKQQQFPKAITINMDGWSGMTTDGSNASQLYTDYSAAMDAKCQAEIANVKESTASMIGMIVCGVLGLIGLLMLPVGLILLGLAAFFGIKWYMSKKNAVTKKQQIMENYATLKQNGVNKIYSCILEWQDAQKKVVEFGNNPVHDIIA